MVSDKNFKVVDGDRDNFSNKYDEFIKLYNNPSFTTVDIRKKLGWSYGIYRKARLEALANGDINDRGVKYKKRGFYNKNTKKKRKPKYYYNDIPNGCIVKKSLLIDGERVYVTYGKYEDSSIAERVVEELKKVNWDKKYLKSIKEKLNIE